MSAPDESCPKCKADCEEGFLVDYAHADRRRAASWISGAPENGWLGPKTTGRRQIRVKAFRCTACGYLESFAPKVAVPEAVMEAIHRGEKILAIKRFREATGAGLRESKDFIEGLQQKNSPIMTSPDDRSQRGNKLLGLAIIVFSMIGLFSMAMAIVSGESIGRHSTILGGLSVAMLLLAAVLSVRRSFE
jgi:hypothetical protein